MTLSTGDAGRNEITSSSAAPLRVADIELPLAVFQAKRPQALVDGAIAMLAAMPDCSNIRLDAVAGQAVVAMPG